MPSLTAFALNCSLKSSADEEKSSTDRMLSDLLAAVKQLEGELSRMLKAGAYPGVPKT